MGARASLRSVRSMSRVAEASIRAALSDRSNHRVVDIFTESIGESLNSVDLQDAIELGKPMETQMQSVNVNGKQRSHIEAVFPLYIDDAATTMFAHVTASEDALDEGTVFVESVFLLARMPSGQVAELAIDVCEQDGSNKDRDGFNQGTRTKVQDAEYKDV
ncbi:hypothetical protein FB639_003276 [Coemansia asiatica]|nr:hypothetical protein FB639_003276 [Coemansia asiatica]